ncbi:TIGR02186 family protein [Primorskyibacter aestuariivivens]|uniref:TIGR02186 family protein n=1 Tax=Primorskyibacter aestuariivivens TaxID=1888912 RepID=UPI002301CA80|nr:TIGR02186 family protein [Primorskyibacter aestuariivivens]MDA7429331.1 TIGR02186 family protein [Primorskyibacter aestuariivivens]
MRILLALLMLLAAPLHAATEEVVLGLSQNRVSITTNFDGSNILIFGAIKRETPLPESDLHVIIAIAGPSESLMVRKKDRRLGIWVNTESVEVDAAPSFYAVATSGPMKQILTEIEDLRHKISIPRAIRSVGAPMEIENAQSFAEAVIRIRKDNGLYQVHENSVEVAEQTLFRTSVQMPANLTEGDYLTRVFLVRDRKVVSDFETVIDVRKVGLERWLYTLSREQPLVYGLMSLFIAIAAGWGASTAFRMLKSG